MRRLLLLVPLAVAACTSFEMPGEKTEQVSQFFDATPPTRVARSPTPRADESICVRVDFVGRKVVAANPQLGLRPHFAAFGSETPELFHVDQGMVCITDGLVKKLTNEADLAAVLSYELGRMVAEREARVKHDLKSLTLRPPIQVPTGNAGQFPNSEVSATVELAKYDQQRRELCKAPERLNPDNLARDYLENAGFQRVDFDRIQPALQAAAKNAALERQVKGVAPSGNWTP